MAASKRITCRTHGGYFTIQPRRGRPPVKCTEDNECTAVKTGTYKPDGSSMRQMINVDRKILAKQDTARKASYKSMQMTSPDFNGMSDTELRAYAREHFSTITKITNRAQLIAAMEAQLIKRTNRQTEAVAKEAVRVISNDFAAASINKARTAKAELVEKGWTVTGKAWTENTEKGHYCASITATRGEEMLNMMWMNGNVIDSQYSLWSTDKPSANGKPPSKLPFDPNEITDSELARLLVGVQVTWYNRLKQGTETAICGRDSIKIEHNFSGTGDEMPEDRIIKFVDAEGHGFQAFRLGALLKVGKGKINAE